MFYKQRAALGKWMFDRACASIAGTPPLASSGSGPFVVTMACHRDLYMYLAAAKTFAARLGPARFLTLDDGSLTEPDKALIREHLRPEEIVPIRSVRTDPCPRGGCWERLAFIADRARHGYVIQLDSDTLTAGPIDEVVRAAAENRSFALGTGMGRSVEDAPGLGRRMLSVASGHIQVRAEQAFADSGFMRDKMYIRGCAGFAGFAKSDAYRPLMEGFSREMQARLGGAWETWGSEQVASNVVVANSPGAVVLPYPKYAEYLPGRPLDGQAFVHFLGTHRWKRGTYRRMARGMIAAMGRA